MPTTIHCVRHAQGFHNLGPEFHGQLDPILTPVGIQQCLTLGEKWEDQSQLSLIMASAMSRTLQTASIVFRGALSNSKTGRTILAIPDLQEASDFPCDTGLDIDKLRQRCMVQNWPVDLSVVHEGWNVKTLTSRYSPTSRAVRARARVVRRLLHRQSEQLEKLGNINPQIVLVSHGAFLHYLTNDWEGANTIKGTGWHNCETRSYQFENDESDELVETMESRGRRGLDYPMFSRDKQAELFEITMRDWKSLGVPVNHED